MKSKRSRSFFARAWMQIRRCHRCGATLQSEGGRVISCGECGAKFAPFYFADTTPADLLRQPLPKGLKTYRPLIGLAEWWTDNAPEVDRESGRTDN